jgi:DNA-binding cell septation regulator SpoVG
MEDVRASFYGLEPVLEGMDLIEGQRGTFVAGPSARTLLAGVTGLADLWTPVG